MKYLRWLSFADVALCMFVLFALLHFSTYIWVITVRSVNPRIGPDQYSVLVLNAVACKGGFSIHGGFRSAPSSPQAYRVYQDCIDEHENGLSTQIFRVEAGSDNGYLSINGPSLLGFQFASTFTNKISDTLGGTARIFTFNVPLWPFEVLFLLVGIWLKLRKYRLNRGFDVMMRK